MIAADIGAALKARMASLSFTPAIPVSWPGRDYTPDGCRFLAVQIEGLTPQRITIGGTSRISGFMAVNVAIPAGKGTREADGIADAVAAHFPVDMRTQMASATLRITKIPTVLGGYRDGAYWRVPVTIPFEAFA